MPSLAILRPLVLDGGDISDRLQESLRVVPMDPLEGGELTSSRPRRPRREQADVDSAKALWEDGRSMPASAGSVYRDVLHAAPTMDLLGLLLQRIESDSPMSSLANRR